jgi:hypothetical protein
VVRGPLVLGSPVGVLAPALLGADELEGVTVGDGLGGADEWRSVSQ